MELMSVCCRRGEVGLVGKEPKSRDEVTGHHVSSVAWALKFCGDTAIGRGWPDGTIEAHIEVIRRNGD